MDPRSGAGPAHRDRRVRPLARGAPRITLDELDYAALHEWSVRDLDGFWSAVAEHLGVIFRDPPTATLGSREMPGAQWFPGATLNYAEHALTPGPGRADDDVALVFAREDGVERDVTHAELRDQVGRARAGLVAAGVGRGDRVVALAPNCAGDPGDVPGRGLARGDLVVLLAGLRGPRGARPVRPDRAVGAAGRRRLLLRREAVRHPADTVAALQQQLPTVRTTVLLPLPRRRTRRLDGTVPLGRVHRRAGRRWSSNRCRSTIRSGCSTPRAPPDCPRASCTGTAGSSSST